ncbi:hypothetical protein C8Q72DRAFT_953069 [Fomitopsis betulina]|nr:hypothetical protein C8Q72DRAFT_953069 [Fomitopsis betulina]
MATHAHLPSHRNDSRVLEALNVLSLPSPSTSIDDFETTSSCTYGDIPILLDPGIIVHTAEITGADRPESSSCVSTGTTPAWTSEPMLEPRPGNRYTAPNGTCERQDAPTTAGASYASLSPYMVSLSLCDDPMPLKQSAFPTSPTASSVTSFSGFSGLYPTVSPSLTSVNFSSSCSIIGQHLTTEGDLRPRSPLDRYHRNFPRSRSTTSNGTVDSLVVSPSPSFMFNTSCPDSPGLRVHRLHKSRSCSPFALANPRSVQYDLDTQAPSSEPSTPFLLSSFDPPGPTTFRHHRRTDSSSTNASNRSMRSVHSSHISSPLASPAAKSRITRNLPDVLDWLENTRIELWIDQEGAHAVRQTFKLAGFTTGYPRSHDANNLVNALANGLAEFMPTMRRSFLFESGKSPTLRRVTIGDDDAKDYVSQQAVLAMSSDGAFAVNGTEHFDLQRHQAPLALRWRFEYFVQGGPRGTEKTLTPLRFSCSPGLVHPTHGRKQWKFHQLFKRNSSTRLFAGKIEAPKNAFAESVLDPLPAGDRRAEKENCATGRGTGASALSEQGEGTGSTPESLRRQLGAKLKRSPRLTATMLKPTTPTELVGLHAEYLRMRGNGGFNDHGTNK